MADETASPRIRERAWITKWDHATDPPTPVEEVAIENGAIVGVRPITADDCAQCGAAQPTRRVVLGDKVARYCDTCWPAVCRAFFAALQSVPQKKEEE